MSTQALLNAIKAELKASGTTYAALGQALGLAESSIKRMFSQGDMPLSRVDQICQVLGIEFDELARRLALVQGSRLMLTEAQEAAVVGDPKLLLVAICALSQWTVEQMLATYTLSEPEVVARLVRLDRLGIIELKPKNRYRLNLRKTLRWRPNGPVMRFFRTQVVSDYYDAGFDAEGETLMLVHGQITPLQAGQFSQRLQRLAEDFAAAHRAGQALPMDDKRSFTLLMGMRSWLFAAFRDFKRHPDGPARMPISSGERTKSRLTPGARRARSVDGVTGA